MFPEILIPYSNFKRSAACYTDTQLMNTLTHIFYVRTQVGKRYSRDVRWEAMEQWRMWHNWKQAFVHFGLMCIEETKIREISFSTHDAELLRRMKEKGRWYKPYWVGWKQFHTEHRELLTHYGECERFALRLVSWEKHNGKNVQDQTSTVQKWTMENGFPDLFAMEQYTLSRAEDFLTEKGAEILERSEFPNPYSVFGWGNQAIDRRSIRLPEPEEQLCETWQTSSSDCEEACPSPCVA